MTTELKLKMDERNRKREQARISGLDIHWKSYKKLRNECTRDQKNVRQEHFRKLFENYEHEHDVKNIHKTTKKLLNLKNGSSPQSFLVDGILIRKPEELANYQMKFFFEKVKTLTNKLQGTNTDPLSWLKKAMINWNKKGKFQKFHFREISISETVNLIGQLGNSTSFGIDEIDALAIKAATVHLTTPIRHLVNVSLMSSTYANKWKLSKLVPLLKSKELNKLHPSSYWPIAILPTISKIVEKAAQKQILEFFEVNKMLNENLHAYRQNRSTTTTLIDLTDKLYKSIDENKIASVMTIDQSAAFDCVPHQTLVDKLRIYNVGEDVLKWIQSYLSLRTQFVVIGRSKSKMYKMERGVPQGSVLGPLLFSIYTNEMSESIRNPDCQDPSHLDKEELFGRECEICGNIIQYADDTTYLATNKHRQKNQDKLIENSENLKTFLNTNGLTINLDKTKIVEIMIKQKRGRTRGEPPKLTVWNSNQVAEVVEDTGQVRILGMNVQANLTWNNHLEQGPKAILPQLRKNLGMMKRLGRILPQNSRNTLARGMILSRLN